MESLETLVDLLTRGDFLLGVLAGVLGLAVLSVVSRTDVGTTGWGLTSASALAVVIQITEGQLILRLVAGVVLLALGGWLIERGSSMHIAGGWSVAALGGIILLGIEPLGPLRVGLSTLVVMLSAGTLLRKWSSLPQTLLGPMFAIGAFGVWTTVPETDFARSMLGISLPLLVATLRPTMARVSGAGGMALGGVFAWVVATGGLERPASIVGGWATLGLLAIVPLVAPRARHLLEERPLLTLALHAVIVVLAARVIGLWESAAIALAAVALLASAAFGAVLFLTRPHTTVENEPESDVDAR